MQLQERSWHGRKELDNLPSARYKSKVLRERTLAVERYRPARKFTNIVANLADISSTPSRRLVHGTLTFAVQVGLTA